MKGEITSEKMMKHVSYVHLKDVWIVKIAQPAQYATKDKVTSCIMAHAKLVMFWDA